MRVKLIGVSDKTRKSNPLPKQSTDYCSVINASSAIVDVKFFRSNLPGLLEELSAKSALWVEIWSQWDTLHYQQIARFGTPRPASVSISFCARTEVDRACIASYRFVPLHA